MKVSRALSFGSRHGVTLALAGAGAGIASAAPSGAVAPSAAPGIVAGASSSMAVVTPATMGTVPAPAGVISGDILVAQVTTDVATAPTPPSGWTLLPGTMLNIDSAYSYGYYHVVSSVAEPASYSWSLATAQRWGAGITAFSGVDTSSPFDVATKSNIVIGGTSKSLTVPGVTTLTADDLVIGGLSGDTTGAGYTTTPPTGWSANFLSTGGKLAGLYSHAQPTPGATGDITWTYSDFRDTGAWVTALKPAPTAPVTPPTVSAISPASGAAAGGTAVTITGTGFLPVATVLFGAVPAGSVTVTSPTSLTATSPAGTGAVNVTVTTTDGTSAVSAAGQFTYLAAPPAAGNNADLSVQLSSPLFAARAPSVTVTVTNHGPTVAGPTRTTVLPIGGDAITGPAGGAASTGSLVLDTPVLLVGEPVIYTINVTEPAGFHIGGMLVYSLSNSGDPNIFNNIAGTLHW